MQRRSFAPSTWGGKTQTGFDVHSQIFYQNSLLDSTAFTISYTLPAKVIVVT